MAVGKHFPGHGDVNVDSHVALPVVPHDRVRLEAVEFVPFKAAIHAGVAGMMSAHIAFPAIESTPNLAATLSHKVMTDLLRDEMKFTGIRMTDSLEMGALQTSGYPVPVAATTALQAGADMLLFNCGHALNYQAHAAIVDAVRRGEIPAARLDEAVRRVLIAKERFGILNPLA
jgi:beta-N-acetylhexosaminidase